MITLDGGFFVMKYMGSKNRIAKDILPIILQNRKPGQWYVEPFVGGANMIDKVEGPRIGADSNPYLIEALKLIRDAPHSIPEIISEIDYKSMQMRRELNGITGFTAFAMSFGGKFFGGYRRDKRGDGGCVENMYKQTQASKRSALKQSGRIQHVKLVSVPYDELEIPEKSIIYCDPPYRGTKKYSTGSFNHDYFWDWCIYKALEGHEVYISEYNAPSAFECVWSKEICSSLAADTGSKKGVEKLFKLRT